MASFPLTRNESTLVTGHADGQVRMHGVLENLPPKKGQRGGRQTQSEEEDQGEGEYGSSVAGSGGTIAKVRARCACELRSLILV